MRDYTYIAWIPLLPLAVFIVLGLFGRKHAGKSAGVIATTTLFISCALSIYTAYNYFFIDHVAGSSFKKITAFKYTWLQFAPGLSIDMSAILDPISIMMIVIVTVISLMVHIYSLGYMKGESRYATYYAFLGLFTFSMLALVLSGNIFQLYIFWELVGVSSFLLIGYYYDKPSAVAAAKKAFIVTRFADLGFLIGILVLAFHAETLDFQILIQRLTTASSQLTNITAASFLGMSLLTWGLVLVFIGGAGKSAMFPLHIWLPDAMEGPTPVSALIHAATMVVAGVFLVARLFPVYVTDHSVMQFITWVGLTSALFAAVIACTQTDIKRVLAYSTMSQIGFMMFALGVSGYNGDAGLGYMASMFHLFTHAFFKSLLFLCAGSIIHLVHSNDMKAMGGLRKLMPLTNICFLIACLAIAGIPPFAGFFSKEEILLAAWHANKSIYIIGLATSALTAFYMFRLYFSIFWKKEVSNVSAPHEEGNFSMKLPLVLLAAGAITAGVFPFSRFVTADGVGLPTHIDILFSIAPVCLAIAAIAFAAWLYKSESETKSRFSSQMNYLYTTVHNKFYIDELYIFITKKVMFNLIARPAAWIDKHVIDGAMNGLATITGNISEKIKGLQSGKVQNYALYFFAGIIGLTILFVWFWK